MFTYRRATEHNHQNLKRVKNHLQQLIDSAKTETKMFDTEYLNSSQDNQQFWHRYNKLTGNKTINIAEPLFRYTNKDEYTFDDAEISNILREVHIDKKDTHSTFDETHSRVYSSSLLRAITTCNHQPFFKIFSNFVHFCPFLPFF